MILPSSKRPLRKKRVLLLVQLPRRDQKPPPVVVTLKGRKLTVDASREAHHAANASRQPEDRNDRKGGKRKAGGYAATLTGDRRGIVNANARSAQMLDVASTYVQGKRVR